MARAQRRSGQSEGVASKRDGLVPAYPSNPSRPTQVCIYLRKADGRQQAHTFYGMYAAKKTLDYLVRGESYTWTQVDEITTDGGLIIKATGMAGRSALERVIEYECTAAEDEWHPSDYECRSLDTMRADYVPVERRELKVIEGGAKPKLEKVERAPRPSREGLVSVGDIAKELGIEPREARGVLRSLKIDKPDAGWAWSAAEAESIKTKIKEGLK